MVTDIWVAIVLSVYPDAVFAIHFQEILWSVCWSWTLSSPGWIDHSSGPVFWHCTFFADHLPPVSLPTSIIQLKRTSIGDRKARAKKIADILMLFFFFYEMVHLYWRLNSETRKKLFLGSSTLVCFWVCFSFIIWCCEQLLWTICVVQKKKRNKNKKLAQASVSAKRQLASSQMILSSWLPNKDCCNMVSAFILFVDTFFFFF